MPCLSYLVLITFVYYVITLTLRLLLCCFTSLNVKDYHFVHPLSICQRLPLVCQSVKDYHLFVNLSKVTTCLSICQRLPLCCFTLLTVKDYLCPVFLCYLIGHQRVQSLPRLIPVLPFCSFKSMLT